MDILELIDDLEDLVDNASPVPLTGKCMIKKDEFFDVLQDIRLQLPEDLKQAKWIKEERQRILAEAQKEADGIIKSAENQIVALINEHEITKQAKENALVIINDAKNTAKEIKKGTKEYVDGLLEETQKQVADIKASVFKALNEVAKQADKLEKVEQVIDSNRQSLI